MYFTLPGFVGLQAQEVIKNIWYWPRQLIHNIDDHVDMCLGWRGQRHMGWENLQVWLWWIL